MHRALVLPCCGWRPRTQRDTYDIHAMLTPCCVFLGVEVEVEEKNEKGRVVGTTYRMVQEEGPRRVAAISGASDAQDFAAVKRGLAAFKMDGGEMDDVWRVVSAVMLRAQSVESGRRGPVACASPVQRRHWSPLATSGRLWRVLPLCCCPPPLRGRRPLAA